MVGEPAWGRRGAATAFPRACKWWRWVPVVLPAHLPHEPAGRSRVGVNAAAAAAAAAGPGPGARSWFTVYFSFPSSSNRFSHVPPLPPSSPLALLFSQRSPPPPPRPHGQTRYPPNPIRRNLDPCLPIFDAFIPFKLP